MPDHRQLRKEILAARNAQSAEEIHQKSEAICDRLLAMPEITNCSSILLYVHIRSEVETTRLLDYLLEHGKTVSVPITYLEGPRLDAIQITDPEKDLAPGCYGILEPRQEILADNLIDPRTIEVILLPGSVFDLRCGRFGYGGGFYDRFVAAAPQALRIGMAFDLQVVERAPLQPHDELLDMVVTESRIIHGTREVQQETPAPKF
ncbi:MAG: 5-formyltetrahydrofolate cyclo-ligase [Desulfopila sp.]